VKMACRAEARAHGRLSPPTHKAPARKPCSRYTASEAMLTTQTQREGGVEPPQ
jgi:hypothetical protein